MTWLIVHPKRTVEHRIIARVTTEVVEKNVSKPESDTVISEPVETQIADSPIVAQGDDNADATERSNLIADDNSSVAANDVLVKEITPTSLASSVEIRAKKISEAQIGDRTPGVNPEGNDGSDESVFREQRHCVYSLLVAKENGSLCFVELLRPDDWLITTGAQLRRKTDGRIVDKLDLITDGMLQLESARDYEPVVWLELPEMGCVGWARVVNVRSFRYTPGVGNLVTGTFRHISDGVINLTVEGQDKPIGVTNSHPFWSVDREEFVPAGELLQGERLLLYSGETARVTQKLPRPGPHVVYNIEVFGEHVYQVTLDDVVVHNGCTRPIYAVSRDEAKKTLINGRSLTYQQAIYRLRHGKDVFAPTRKIANQLQHAAIGGKPILDPPHGATRWFKMHYHGQYRSTRHAFFPRDPRDFL